MPEIYKGIETLYQAPLFSFILNNLATPQLCGTILQDSPYSQQLKINLKDRESIQPLRIKQMFDLVPDSLLFGHVV